MESICRMRLYGGWCLAVQVTCSGCGVVRLVPLHVVRQLMEKGLFTGCCKPCGTVIAHAATAVTKRAKGGTRRLVDNGYIALSRCAVGLDEMPMFDAMRGKGSYVLEHRWVMAKHLARPLTTRECVDHRDGDKTHNTVENFRLYLKGAAQEGSGNGYGTYYHEWQMALAEIRDLETQLHSIGSEPVRSKRVARIAAESLPFTPV